MALGNGTEAKGYLVTARLGLIVSYNEGLWPQLVFAHSIKRFLMNTDDISGLWTGPVLPPELPPQ
jgi:hypothetical protein